MYKFSQRTAIWFERYMPSSLVFAIVLTFVAMVASFIFTDTTLVKMTKGWVGGIGSLMTFAFQAAWGFASGLVLVRAPVVKNALAKAARTVKSPSMAILVVATFGVVTMWINIYVSAFLTSMLVAIFAREIKGTDIRILTAAAYSSIVIWHGGTSGSIPLLLNTPDNAFMKLMGGLVPTTQTIFSPMNLTIAVLIALSCIIFFYVVHPRKESDIVSIQSLTGESMGVSGEIAAAAMPGGTGAGAAVAMATAAPAEVDRTFASWIENSRIFSALFGLALLGTALYVFATGGLASLNLINIGILLLGLGFLAHPSPVAVFQEFQGAARQMSGIILEFPLYGGIMGVMAGTGLAAVISGWFTAIATADTLPLWTFISAGFVNLFVPSGGSQWAVQGPLVIPAAQSLGADQVRVAMAVAYGDTWTNLIQPFWTLLYLPLIGAGAKLRPRDFMGFALPLLVITGIVYLVGLYFF